MKTASRIAVSTGLAGLMLVASAQAAGPDIDISNLPDSIHYGPTNGVHAYVVGFTVCNRGDADAEWVSNTSRHPVEGWNMYRIKEGRIEQIGLSWLKHGFYAASSAGCGNCNFHSGNVLGVGCQDIYDSGLNSYQPALGPRFEVNPSTGYFPYPFSNPQGSTGDAIFKYCQVPEADLANPGAIYAVEGILVHPGDADAGNDDNNASYRLVNVNPSTYVLSFVGATQRDRPGIMAWKDHGLGVNAPDPGVRLASVDVPNDGRFWVASKAADLGGGVWRYEYAVQNLNSDRAAGGFQVPIPDDAFVNNTGFHGVTYHSGEPFDNTAWTATVQASTVAWSTAQPYTVDPNANAIRWGTLYNFRFDADVPPALARVSLGLFKPGQLGQAGGPDALSVAAVVPRPSPYPGDFDGDGDVDRMDYAAWFACYSGPGVPYAPPGCAAADFDGDGDVDLVDLAVLLNAFTGP